MGTRVRATPMPTADGRLLAIGLQCFIILMKTALYRNFSAEFSSRKSGKICHPARVRIARRKTGAAWPFAHVESALSGDCRCLRRPRRSAAALRSPSHDAVLPCPVSGRFPPASCRPGGLPLSTRFSPARESNEVTPGFAGSRRARALAGEPGQSGKENHCGRGFTPRLERGRRCAPSRSGHKFPPTANPRQPRGAASCAGQRPRPAQAAAFTGCAICSR